MPAGLRTSIGLATDAPVGVATHEAGENDNLDILPALKREDSTVGVRLRRVPGGNLRVCMLLVGTVTVW
jgi:hypothetical protein